MTDLGALRSITFKRVLPDGLDEYEVTFEKGMIHYQFQLDVDGKVVAAMIHQGTPCRGQ